MMLSTVISTFAVEAIRAGLAAAGVWADGFENENAVSAAAARMDLNRRIRGVYNSETPPLQPPSKASDPVPILALLRLIVPFKLRGDSCNAL